jgi:hypothetical protein
MCSTARPADCRELVELARHVTSRDQRDEEPLARKSGLSNG